MESVATLPVDLGRRSQVERRPVFVTTIQDDLRAPDVGRDGFDGMVDDLPNPHRSGQMYDTIDLTDRVLHHRVVQNGIDDQMERGIVTDLGQVVQAARGQVVDHEDGLPRLEEALHQV